MCRTEKIIKQEQEMAEIIKRENIKVTGMSLLEQFDAYKVSDENKELSEYIMDEYKRYIGLLPRLDKYLNPFLETLKDKEIVRNQGLENVDGVLVDVFLKYGTPTATNKLIADKMNNQIYTPKDLDISHQKLLFGTADLTEDFTNFRTDNTTFVGKVQDGQRIIDYVPIDYKEINDAAKYIMNMYNNDDINEEYEVFSKPIFVHGLIAALQMFRDGNTRLARVYENVKIWSLTKNITNMNLELPSVYISEALYNTNKRGEYRNLIHQMAINPTKESFNKWFEFNLLLIEKQLNSNIDKMSTLSKYLRK